jgi:hypothetical protein
MEASSSLGSTNPNCQFLLLIEIYDETAEEILAKMLSDEIAKSIDAEIMRELIAMNPLT